MTIAVDEQKLITTMEELAAKVRAAERERCANIAKTLSKIDPHGPRIALEIAAQIERGE
jgi:hypothetical protein